MKLSNVFLILVQFTLYHTNKIYKNTLQKLVRFVQTGELFLAFFICFVHCSKLLKSTRGAIMKKPWRWKINDWLIQLQTRNWTKIVLLSLKYLLCFTEHSIVKMKIPVVFTGLIQFLFGVVMRIWWWPRNPGRFHYARASGQRPVGMPEENGTTFSDQTGPSKRNGYYPFFSFSEFPT